MRVINLAGMLELVDGRRHYFLSSSVSQGMMLSHGIWLSPEQVSPQKVQDRSFDGFVT